jgi:hypothetical protein
MSQGRIVSFDGPTRDNTLLSRPTMDNEDATNSDVVIAQEIASA